MARLPRVVVVDVPHHVTQRGNGRQCIFLRDSDRLVYLDLLKQHADLCELSLLGYCLMSNHVHLIAIPRAADSLAQTLKQTHGRYAAYWNARRSSSGHVWQGRFYSCPLGDSHCWAALRYTELNPVRAGLVTLAEHWRWSGAGAHCAASEPAAVLEKGRWSGRWTAAEWSQYLNFKDSAADSALRQCTHTGRPFGTEEFIMTLEKTTSRSLAPRKGGRPKQKSDGAKELGLPFVA